MLFGKKREDGRKELPDLPHTPDSFSRRGMIEPPEPSGDMDEESQALPSFPRANSSEGFSRAAIKEAVRSEQRDEDGMSEVSHPAVDAKNINVVEMEEWSPQHMGPSTFHERGPHENVQEEIRPKRSELRGPQEEITSKKKVGLKPQQSDIFVRIDKFHSARRALAEAQDKLMEVEETIKKIRDVKMREEQEIGGWEKSLEDIKSRISDVNSNIFEKVE